MLLFCDIHMKIRIIMSHFTHFICTLSLFYTMVLKAERYLSISKYEPKAGLEPATYSLRRHNGFLSYQFIIQLLDYVIIIISDKQSDKHLPILMSCLYYYNLLFILSLYLFIRPKVILS